MKTTGVLFIIISLLCAACTGKNQTIEYPLVEKESLTILPDILDDKPDMPSPAITPDGREFVLVGLQNGHYTWIDATVENGDPFDYKSSLYGKGNQLLADSIDFPHLARHGVHSDQELSSCFSITGRSVAQITIDGRPWGSSGVGFMKEDETILSVIWGDNKIVKKMGLTHPDLARPLFHIWNTNWMMGKLETRHRLLNIIYNNKELDINIEGSRGWQESIFNDEILGSGHMHFRGSICKEDADFLNTEYKDLTKIELDSLKTMLSHIHTGEMVLYYITRYGFYEGRNEYKPDPLVVAYMFGLRSIEEIHEASGGDLFAYLTTPHTENPPCKEVRRKTQDQRKYKDLSYITQQPATSNQQPAIRNPEQSAVSSQQSAVNNDPTHIDSLVKVMAAAGRHWNNPAEKLIAIGDPAVPSLVDLLFDKSQSQWSRRVAAMTLNQIHSPLTVEHALRLLFDTNEDWVLRNQIIPSLRGFDLSGVKKELWEIFNTTENESYWGNIAALLRTADTSLAYQAYHKLYNIRDGYGKRTALQNLASLRPHEATYWYLQAIQSDDWMTGNVAMDSLVNLKTMDAGLLIDLYNQEGTTEETKWMIVHTLAQVEFIGREEFFTKAKEDSSWLIRMEAIYNLNQINQTN